MADDTLEQRAETARVRVARASAVLDAAITSRDALIVDMLNAGWSLGRMAASLQITKQRAQQLRLRALKTV